MGTRVRSFAKVNLGLAIGPVRGDGFHGLATLYQTVALHDWVTVEVNAPCGGAAGGGTTGSSSITLTTDHPGVPVDERNTVWKMLERALERMGVVAEVKVHIEKVLPVQGGLGAGSANAAAALIGLERELKRALPEAERLEIAAEVGSDVPLFLVGGAVLGTGRGEQVVGLRNFRPTPCVVAVPEVGVSTALAFRDWDALFAKGRDGGSGGGGGGQGSGNRDGATSGLTAAPETYSLEELSRVYTSLLGFTETRHDTDAAPDTSGIVRGSGPAVQAGPSETSQGDVQEESTRDDLAEDTLLALVRTGIENDFEEVVFPQYPLLREIKRELMGVDSDAPATYAALSGSGSALFGLYRSQADAEAAKRRVQAAGCRALMTETLPRLQYWQTMFAE